MDHQDPENQLRVLREMVAGKGWAVYDEYIDRASAGDWRRRPQWHRLMEAARLGRINVIVVWKLDRAFRSALDALRGLQELAHQGVAFVAITQPIDTSSPTGRLLTTMLAAVAEIEHDLISERTRLGMARARAAGKHLGRPSKKEER